MGRDMDKEAKMVLKIVAVVAVATIVPVAVAAALLANSSSHSGWPTNWDGWGDWEACAEIASVKPQEAVETAASSLGLSLMDVWGKAIDIGPVFVKQNGDVFGLTCSGGIEVGAQRYPWERPTVSQDTYAWEVSISTPNTGCMASLAWVEWDVSASLYHAHGC
jgi:hypothetical protein